MDVPKGDLEELLLKLSVRLMTKQNLETNKTFGTSQFT